MTDEEFAKLQAIAYRHLSAFAQKRTTWYSRTNKSDGVNVRWMLQKDVVMFASRGVLTSDEYAREAFKAIESSSEETSMGNTWQAIIAEISTDTIDSGDLTTVRDGAVWVCELKSQENTTNSNSWTQGLRELKTRLELEGRHKRASGQPMKAAFCVTRSRRAIDETRVYRTQDGDLANRDLNGFEYRYITGKALWQWLTGLDDPAQLVTDASKIELGKVREAREQAIQDATQALNDTLDDHELPHTIDGVLELRRILS